MSGYNSEAGHAWVIDGYERRNAVYTYYYLDAPTVVYDTRVAAVATYFHCNLGWGENNNYYYNNGYFNSNSFLHNNNLMGVYDITPNNN